MTKLNSQTSQPTNAARELTVAELDAVSGGGESTSQYAALMSMLSNIEKATSDTNKTIINNVRA